MISMSTQSNPEVKVVSGLDTYHDYKITKICTIDVSKLDVDSPFFDQWQRLHPRPYFHSLYLTPHTPWCWDVSLPLAHNNQDYGLAETGKRKKLAMGHTEKEVGKWLAQCKAGGVVTHEFEWRSQSTAEARKVRQSRPGP